jgi:hypothetical protein
MKRTETYQEIKPLVDLCKSGKLFEVQEWIASGKPVNPPPSESGYRKKSPLEIAIELGFHSLIKVLLEGGADINEPRYHSAPALGAGGRRFKSSRPDHLTYKNGNLVWVLSNFINPTTNGDNIPPRSLSM